MPKHRLFNGLLGAVALLAAQALPVTIAQAEEITLRFAGQHPPDHMGTRAIEAIAAEVEEQTDGRISFRLHPSGELGDYTLIYDELIRGTVDMALISAPAQHDPRIEAQWLPYIAQDHAAVRTAFGDGSFLSGSMHEIHGNAGVEFLAFFGEGFIGLGATKAVQDASQPDTDKNLLVRVAPFRPAELVAKDLGFRASTIPYSDTFGALQTGVVEGWIGGSANLNYSAFRDVITHFYAYNMFYEATSFFVNRDRWESLSDEDRRIIRDAVVSQSEKSFDVAKSEDDEYLERMKEAGIEIVTFDEQTLGDLAQYVRSNTWPELEERFGSDFLQEINEALDN